MRASLFGILLALSASPVLADHASPWSFGGSIGYDVPVGGKVLEAGASNSLNLSTLNPALGGTGILRLRGTDYKDAYDPAVRATIEVRYAMSESSEFFGALSYSKAESKKGVIGCLEVASSCSTNLTGQLADLKQTGIEIGYRQWINMAMLGDSVRPYFSVRGGVVKTDAIHAFIQTPTADIAHWRLYKETYSYMIGGDVGATVAISPNAEIGGEVGLRYLTALREVDSDFGAIGLSRTNDKSERLSVPVSFRLNASF
jgi:hypothetical protein